MDYDFSGWATKNGVLCTDGTMMHESTFADQDGTTVPLVFNHNHDDPTAVIGNVILKNLPQGVRVYGKFNNTETGKAAKEAVQHGDINGLSVYANHLTRQNTHGISNIQHGTVREVSLVYGVANPGSFIDSAVAHSDDEGEAGWIYGGVISHSDEEEYTMSDNSMSHIERVVATMNDAQKNVFYGLIENASGGAIRHGDEDISDMDEDDINAVIDSMTDEQREVLYGTIGAAVGDDDDFEDIDPEEDDDSEDYDDEDYDDGFDDSEDYDDEDYDDYGEATGTDGFNHSEDEGDTTMGNWNAFEDGTDFDAQYDGAGEDMIMHSDEIFDNFKNNGGTFKNAVKDVMYNYGMDDDIIAHGYDSIEQLYPDFHDLYTGEPNRIKTSDWTWAQTIINGTEKSPFERIRTKFAEVPDDVALDAKGYVKGAKKTEMGNIKFSKRTTDGQMIYIKDHLDREDIIKITDFDAVTYLYGVMREKLNNTIGRAILIGDGRDDSSPDKISPEHIRPIWTDDEFFTIHRTIDFDAAKKEIQGSDTSKHFSDNYIMTEAMIQTLLYAKEDYRGSGNLTMFIAPHMINQMLLSRDFNGRRVYNTKNDLQSAFDVTSIQNVEQLEGKTRKTADGKTMQLVAILLNLKDYTVGSVKGGEITKFNQFDIDYNQEKYLMETYLCGALTRYKSAIVIEQDVTSTSTTKPAG